MCKYGGEDYFPFTLSYLTDIVFVLHASEEPLAYAAATLKDEHLTGFYGTSKKGCFTSQRFPLSHITLCHLLRDPRDHRAVVFKISTAKKHSLPDFDLQVLSLFPIYRWKEREEEGGIFLRAAPCIGWISVLAASMSPLSPGQQDGSTLCGTLSFVTHHLRGNELIVFEVSTTPFLRKCSSSHCLGSVFRFHG